MDPQILSTAAIVSSLALMAYAAYSDWRRREVPDTVWIILGAIGIVLTGLRTMADGFDAGYLMILAGSVLIILDVAVDIERPRYVSAVFYAAMAALFIIPLLMEHGEHLYELYVIPICYVVFYVFYIFGLLRGGADAKCFMIMAMVFNVYPVLGPLPLIDIPAGTVSKVIIFPLALLFNAALFTVVGMLIYAFVNRVPERPKVPGSVFWRRMPIIEAKEAHVWPKQDVIDGNVCIISEISDDKEIYDRLTDAGEKEVWVTPIIPFMVPVFAALLFMLTVGNILFIPF